jgi:hypothetical protein
MFDYMIKENKLMSFIKQAGLNATDLTFVKELIFNELNEQANDRVS